MFLMRNYPPLFHIFQGCTQNNLKCQIQKMIHQAVQIYHSKLEQIFRIYCFVEHFYIFPCILDGKN